MGKKLNIPMFPCAATGILVVSLFFGVAFGVFGHIFNVFFDFAVPKTS